LSFEILARFGDPVGQSPFCRFGFEDTTLQDTAIASELATLGGVRQLPNMAMGAALRLFGLTARAIRFYEEKGLIEARRDERNHRYFDDKARRRLALITELRAAGLSLADIREVLAAEERSGRGRDWAFAKLQRRRDAVRSELDRVEAALSRFGETAAEQ
jgi:DNA-binding transcriptional MerR regulator